MRQACRKAAGELMQRSVPKTSNHERILRILQSAGAPMTAYQVLDAARKHDISAPPTVYRALSKLIAQGVVHRLESINAYVACADADHQHGDAVFAICRDCGQVEELSEAGTLRRLKATANQTGFKVDKAVIELKGRCVSCVASHV
jgi:Fur family zinc uptake transcriptional regulator